MSLLVRGWCRFVRASPVPLPPSPLKTSLAKSFDPNRSLNHRTMSPTPRQLAARSRWGSMCLRLFQLIEHHTEAVRNLSVLEHSHRLTDRLTGALPAGLSQLSLSTVTSVAIQKDQVTLRYPKDPDRCDHPAAMMQGYGGAYGKLRICNACGSRWKLSKENNTWTPAAPKISPNKSNPMKPKAAPDKKESALRRRVGVINAPPAPGVCAVRRVGYASGGLTQPQPGTRQHQEPHLGLGRTGTSRCWLR